MIALKLKSENGYFFRFFATFRFLVVFRFFATFFVAFFLVAFFLVALRFAGFLAAFFRFAIVYVTPFRYIEVLCENILSMFIAQTRHNG